MDTTDQDTVGTDDQVNEDNQTPETSQSQPETEGAKEYKLKTVEGEKVFTNMDELYEYTQKVNPGFTQAKQEAAEERRQRLELQQRLEALESKAESQASAALENSELVQQVDPTVKEAIIGVVKPVLTEEIKRLQQTLEQQKQQEMTKREFDNRLAELEKKYPGGNGLPKFSRDEVLQAMQDPSNEIFDPGLKFKLLHEAEFNDYLVKQALTNKGSDVATESTTGKPPSKPKGNTPKTFEEASRAAMSR